MSSPAVRRAFIHRVRALARELPEAIRDDVEALHRSRVASRRVREILPVLQENEGNGSSETIRRRVRRLTRALGGVRELDVALLILDDLAARHPDLASAVTAVRRRVGEERRARREAMSAQLEETEGLRLPEDLEGLADSIRGDQRLVLLGRLARRVARRADRLEFAVDEAGSLFVSERLHAVRIAAKQLRYALELVHEFGGVATRRLTNALKRYQDLLGRLHDLEVVSGYVRREAWTAPESEAANASRLQDVIDLEIRELHAAYLPGVSALYDVVTTCRAKVQPKLAAGRRQRRQSGEPQ